MFQTAGNVADKTMKERVTKEKDNVKKDALSVEMDVVH